MSGYIYNNIENFSNTSSLKGKSKINDNKLLHENSINLNKLAKNGSVDNLIGRENEINNIIQTLSRRTKNNPILVGEPGVGKTAIIEYLAYKIVNGEVPNSLKSKVIYSLDISSIVSGTKFRGQFEEKFKSIISECLNDENVILFIDEIHTIVGAGNGSGNLDIGNILKPYLARGEIKCIGATTFEEFEDIEEDGALNRRFQKILIEEPDVNETFEILTKIKDKYETYHNVEYSNEIIELIVSLSNEFFYDKFFPDKAIDIMDEVGSYKYIQESKIPKKIKLLKDELLNVKTEKQKCAHSQNFQEAANLKEREEELEKKIQFEYEQFENKRAISKIKREDVLEVVSNITKVPLKNLNKSETNFLKSLEDNLNSEVIGQEEASKKVSIHIKKNKLGLRKSESTISNFLFLGSSGTGKTFFVKKLAELLFGSQDNLIRIDMSEYSEPSSISKLIGSSPGYIGYERGGYLTQMVERNPFSIVLLDEIEKAHKDVHNLFLQIFDDGYITDSKGKHIDFSNCIIIMTSNEGSYEFKSFGNGIGFNKKDSNNESEFLKKSLSNKFSEEFLNRIDDIIVFKRLSKDNIKTILNKSIDNTIENIENAGYHIHITKKIKDFICDKIINKNEINVRLMLRDLGNYIENPITEFILNNDIKRNSHIKISIEKDSLKFSKVNIKK